MSLSNWLTGNSPKPGCKRKLTEIESAPESPSAKRKFSKALSQNSFDWYQQDETGKWHCSVCRNAKIDNVYSRGHETPAKTTNHTRHASSQSHLTSITKSTLAKEKPMQKLITAKLQKDDDNVLGYLKCAYYLSKRELPKDEFKHIVNLADMLGVDLVKDSNFSYTSNTSVNDFQSAIASVVLETKLQQLTCSEIYSLMIDESTDNANSKRLLIYAQYFTGADLGSCLISNVEITEGTADAGTIVNKVMSQIEAKGLKIGNLVGMGTDGASVMTGRKNGVVVRMQQHSPAMVGVHCAAHRCALAASQAANSIPQMAHYSRVVSNIFHYFSNSALRSNKLRAIQSILELPHLKYAEVHSVRWLSLENAVSVIYRTYPALCMALSHEAINNPAAKGLSQEVHQFRFIAITHLLMDILPFLGRLSKVFQARNVDYSKIQPMVDSTCESLKDLCECEGVFVDKLSEFIEKDADGIVLYKRSVSESAAGVVKSAVSENVQFEGFVDDVTDDSEATGIKLQHHHTQADILHNLTPKYTEKIVHNLESRFTQSSLIDSMKVIVPANISNAKKIGELPKYGESEIQQLQSQFGDQFGIEKDECVSEYAQYKRLISGSYASVSMLEATSVISEKYSESMPNMLKLMKCCVTIPISTVQCERGFSTQNRIKSRLRTRMNSTTLNELMRISEDGPDIREFDFTRALVMWKKEKIRRIYQ